MALIFLSGCASYYHRNVEFQTAISKGELSKAEDLLEGSKKAKKDRNKLLYLFNMGYINHLQQDFIASNAFFNEADLLIEDYRKNYGSEALALMSNPEVKPYKSEDFESVMVHYYKALNYLQLKDFESSLVEARRMNLILNQLNDKYADRKNRYQADAFANIIMGLAYEASGKLNDAFIAYRNAYEIYAGKFGYFGLEAPDQLKADILRLASANGFTSELAWYEKQFGMSYYPKTYNYGEAILIWQNGMGPVKDQVFFNFVAIPGEGGFVNFTNEELGLSFAFDLGDRDQQRKDILDLQIIRVAFPKYLERPNFYSSAYALLNGNRYNLEKTQDINAIAFKCLEDRFAREMATSLIRLALKKAAEIELQRQNGTVGLLASVTNAVTEKADTRNWQTLPHDIFYARIPLNEGENQIELNMINTNNAIDNAKFNAVGKKNAMVFIPYTSLEHLPAFGYDVSGPQKVKHK